MPGSVQSMSGESPVGAEGLAGQDRRPSWHVDVKWLTGIALTFVLGVTLTVGALWRLSAPSVAIDMTSVTIAAVFSPQGLDDPGDMVTLRREMVRDGVTTVDPLGNGMTEISLHDLETLSPREVRIKIFRQVAEALYFDSPEQVAAEAGMEPDEAEAFAEQATLLSVLSHRQHTRFRTALLVLAAAIAVLAWAMVRCSHRFGRLVSPSVVLLLSSMPFVLPTLLLAGAARGGTSEAAPEGRIAVVLTEVTPIISSAVLPLFLVPPLMGLAGLAVAGCLRVWYGARGPGRHSTSSSPSIPASR